MFNLPRAGVVGGCRGGERNIQQGSNASRLRSCSSVCWFVFCDCICAASGTYRLVPPGPGPSPASPWCLGRCWEEGVAFGAPRVRGGQPCSARANRGAASQACARAGNTDPAEERRRRRRRGRRTVRLSAASRVHRAAIRYRGSGSPPPGIFTVEFQAEKARP